MFLCLFIAILATLLWINILVAESITSKTNPYANSVADSENDKKTAKVKTILIIIMALFWAAVIRFY